MRERASSLARTVSMKRVFSRRSLQVSSSTNHLRYVLRSFNVSRIPIRNTTVFLHWEVPLLGLSGDCKRSVVQATKTAEWQDAKIVIDTIAEEKTEIMVLITLYEDVVVRTGRNTTWKQLGQGSFNINLMNRTQVNQLLIIPLENGKKNTCMLEMRIDGEAPNIADLFENIKASICCDDAYMIEAFYHCPLKWNEDGTPEGAIRLKSRWPRIAERVNLALQATQPTRTWKSQAYWCTVLRHLECEGDVMRDTLRPLRVEAVDGIMQGLMPTELYNGLIEAHWVDADLFQWASSVAREVSSRALDPLVEGKTEFKTQHASHVERFSEWLSCRFAICEVRMLLERALDELLKE